MQKVFKTFQINSINYIIETVEIAEDLACSLSIIPSKNYSSAKCQVLLYGYIYKKKNLGKMSWHLLDILKSYAI